MLARRRLLGTTLFGSLVGATMPSADDAAQQTSERQITEIVNALEDIKKSLDATQSFAEVAPIRTKQIDFLRTANKLPDFIDVGIDVWLSVYDWHVKHQQPITMGRDAGGRYTITYMTTQLVMRPDLVTTFVSLGYDGR